MSEKIVEFLRTEKIPKNKKPSPPKKIYEELRDCTFHPKINRVYCFDLSQEQYDREQSKHAKGRNGKL